MQEINNFETKLQPCLRKKCLKYEKKARILTQQINCLMMKLKVVLVWQKCCMFSLKTAKLNCIHVEWVSVVLNLIFQNFSTLPQKNALNVVKKWRKQSFFVNAEKEHFSPQYVVLWQDYFSQEITQQILTWESVTI